MYYKTIFMMDDHGVSLPSTNVSESNHVASCYTDQVISLFFFLSRGKFSS